MELAATSLLKVSELTAFEEGDIMRTVPIGANHSQQNVWYGLTNATTSFIITLEHFKNKSHSNPTGIDCYKPTRSFRIAYD